MKYRMKNLKDATRSGDLMFSVIEEVLTDGSSAWSVGIRDISNQFAKAEDRPIVEVPVVSEDRAYELFEQLSKAAGLN